MSRILTILFAVFTFLTARPMQYEYTFNNTPLPDALIRIGKTHPEINLFFIYKDLDNYKTSARIKTDDIFDAIRSVVGLNPVTVTIKGQSVYIEALQHGKYQYKGNLIGSDREPVVAATILLLNPSDSTVITYGISDENGRFDIPCDRTGVLAKMSCMGYETVYRRFKDFAVGTLLMQEKVVKLNDVTVRGNDAVAYSDKTVYLPTQRQKNAAQNASDLLRFMTIPQIKINAITNGVTDNLGTPVSLYINGVEASAEELEGLLTTDVRRVEYLEFPTDPRYKGAQRVINFIVQEYAYGGYTKLTASENFLTGLSSRVNIFSKFSYKKMNYDLYIGSNNWISRHIGNTVSGDYLLYNEDGTEYSLHRDEIIKNSKYRQNQFPITMRATYNTDKVQIRNTIGFTYTDTPESSITGNVSFSNKRDDGNDFYRADPSRTNSAMYSGSYYFVLPKKYTVDVTPTFNYSHVNDILEYSSGNSTNILRHAKEDAYNFRIDAYGRKKVGMKHSFMIGANGGLWKNNLHYTGTSQYDDRFSLAFAAGLLGYNFTTSKVSLRTDVGIAWEKSDINGKTLNDLYPFTHINLQYSFSPKHLASGYFQYATNSPTISQKASDVLRDNEYMYITGNPYVKDARHVTLNLAYTWLSSNTFSMSVYGQYYGCYDRLVTIYSPYADGKAVIRDYTNDGNFTSSKIGMAANLKLLDGNLNLYVCPEQYFYGSTGIYDCSYNPFVISAQASYYMKKLYFLLHYTSPERQLWIGSNTIYRSRDYYSLSIGWSNENWNLRLSAANIFNKGWVGATREMSSKYYTEHCINYGSSYHPYINVSATYSFNYGKKIQRGNEVGEQSGANSGILK